MSHGFLVRSSLRRVLRAQRAAFAGDVAMQRVATTEILSRYRGNADAAVDDAEAIAGMLKMADETVEFLEGNVVQNALAEDGHYVLGEGAVKVEEVGVRRPGD